MEINYKSLISESTTPFFTRQNLKILLGRNRRTVDYRIKSLIKDGILVAVKSGFYVNNVLYKSTSTPKDMVLYIGGILVPQSYVSLEYALSFYGFLAEQVYTVTYITTQKTRKFQNNLFSFSYRNIKPALYWGYMKRPFGDLSYQMASPAKAMFDFLYLTPVGTDQATRNLLFDSRFNWGVFSAKDKKEFQEIIEKSTSKKMANILKYLTQENVI